MRKLSEGLPTWSSNTLQMNLRTVLNHRNGLFYVRTAYREADLLIASEKLVAVNTGISEFIRLIESVQSYIDTHPEFIYSLEPVEVEDGAPPPVSASAEASFKAGVGPMAALPGALADFTLDAMLRKDVDTAIVENGGEVAIRMCR
ncbi:MAG: hypothetical protein ACUVQY_07270, partial [Thermoproteota archaeon]